MKQTSLSLRVLLFILGMTLSGLTVNAQVIVTATAGNPGPLPYPDLASAFAAINAGTHQGSIGVGIASSTTETGPCVLNASGAGPASYTLVAISPISDAVTVSGATASGRGLIELNGADNVIIDGDNPNTAGTNRNLTIVNTAANTITFTSCIRLATSTLITNADNVIIRNCNLNGSGTGMNNSGSTTETCTWGIIASGNASTVSAITAPGALTAANTTIAAGQTVAALSITNNNIQTCSRGIAINGGATSVAPNVVINNNMIGNSTATAADQVCGIGITGQGSANGLISGNTIYLESYIGSSTVSKAIDLGTISSANVGTWTIENNIIGRVKNNNPGTFNATGINIAGGTNNIIRNNFVTNLTNDQTAGTGAFSTTFGIMGIRLGSGTGHKVYYNSVHLTGTIPGSISTDLCMCLAITTTGVTGCDVRNNVFSDVLTGGNPTGFNTTFTCVFLPSGATSALNLTWNNNVYYQGSTAYSVIAQTGLTAGTGNYTATNFNPAATAPATNFRSYTSTLSAAGTNDNASAASTAAAPFISTSNLHVNLAAPNANDLDTKAIVIAGTTLDIDLATRDASTPDIGADEFVLATCSAANGGTISPATQTTCAGSAITMTSTGATSGTGITYQWMVSTTSGGPYANVSGGSGANTTSYSTGVLSTGTFYYVLQTTCTFGPLTGLSNEVMVTVNPLPTVTVTPGSASICQPGGSSVTLTASGANNYAWLPVTGLTPAIGAIVSANPSATTSYTVTGVDVNGCTGSAATTITVAEQPGIVAVSATPAAVCAGGNSQLTVTAGTTTSYALQPASFLPINSGTGTVTLCSGGTATTALTSGTLDDGYWNNISMPFVFNFFGVGYNTINVQSNGVISFTPFATTTGYPATIPAGGNPNNFIAACYGDLDWRFGGIVSCYTSGSAPNRVFVINYNGTSGGGFYNSGLAPTVLTTTQIQLFENSNVIQVHSTNIAGTTTIAHTQGIENLTGTGGVPVPSRNNSTTWTAVNDAVQFIPNGGTLTYAWLPSTYLSSTTINNPMANSAMSTTTYTVSITANGCTATGSVTLTVNPLPVVNLGPDVTQCSGNVTLDAQNAGSAYLWNDASTNQTLTVSSGGTYDVAVTDGNGCVGRDTVMATINPLPVVNLGPDVTQCAGSVTFDAQNVGSAYLWNDASTNQTLSVNATGTYDVAVTDANGCVGRDTVMATINPLPVVNLGPDVTQCAGIVTLDAQNSGSAYLWNDASTNQTLSVSASGTYDVAVTDGNGCVGRDTAMVMINPLPVVNLGPDVTQCGGTVTLDAQNAGSAYLWNDASTNQTLSVNASGTYDVTVTDANGCSNSDTATITINSLPVVNLGADVSLCPGDSAVLDAQNTGSTYLWSDASANQTLMVNATGSYDVTVTDGNGCSNSDTVMVTLHSNPTVNIGPDVTQCGGTVTLDAQNAGSTYAWNDATTNQTLDATSTGTYYVTVTDVNGCSGSDTAMITINTPPNVTFTFGTSSMCINDANLTLSGGSPAGGAYSGPGVSGTTFNAQTAGAGNQAVTYSYTDVNGCSGNAVHTIVVDSCLAVTDPTLDQIVNLYPNPNNGVFQVSVGSGNYSSLLIEVFTVQGKLIFSDKVSDAGAGYVRTIDLSTFANGSYVVKITTDKETVIRKIVTQD